MQKPAVSARVTRRLQSLLRQLVAEEGTQKAAGARLGVGENVVGKTIAGERSRAYPNGHWFLAAWLKLGLPVDYFTCEGPDDLEYRQYLRDRTTTADIAALAREVREMREEQRRRDSEESHTRRKAT